MNSTNIKILKKSKSLPCTCEVGHIKSIKLSIEFAVCDLCSEKLFFVNKENEQRYTL